MKYRVPDLSECVPGIEPFEFQALVRMSVSEETTKGGIILTDATRSGLAWGADHGRLVAVSPAAFSYHAWKSDVRLPGVGDVVFCGQHAGQKVKGADGEEYRLISDREIRAVIERAPTARELEEARVTAEFAHITQPLEAAVERLFSGVGADTAAFRTPGGNAVACFANGALKPEGEWAAPFDPDALVENMLAAIREQFPSHAGQRLIWRRRPVANVYPAVSAEQAKLWGEPARDEQVVISLRIGVDDIQEVQHAA